MDPFQQPLNAQFQGAENVHVNDGQFITGDHNIVNHITIIVNRMAWFILLLT